MSDVKCDNPNCDLMRHSVLENNGGTHCCASCKANKPHGPLCEHITSGASSAQRCFVSHVKFRNANRVGFASAPAGATLLTWRVSTRKTSNDASIVCHVQYKSAENGEYSAVQEVFPAAVRKNEVTYFLLYDAPLLTERKYWFTIEPFDHANPALPAYGRAFVSQYPMRTPK